MDAWCAVGEEAIVVVEVAAVPHKANAEKRATALGAKPRITNWRV